MTGGFRCSRRKESVVACANHFGHKYVGDFFRSAARVMMRQRRGRVQALVERMAGAVACIVLKNEEDHRKGGRVLV